MEQEIEKNYTQTSEQIVIRDDRNLFYYVLEIVILWLAVVLVLIKINFDIKYILTSGKDIAFLIILASIVLFRRGFGIYPILKSGKEQIILENDKIKQSAYNREIDISNVGEVYLCSNSMMTDRLIRMTIFRKVALGFGWSVIIILSLVEIRLITFLVTYGLTVKYLAKYIISLIRNGGFEWRWYHLLVVIPKDNDNAVIITLDSKNITVIEQYLKSTLQLAMSDIHKCFMPPSKKQLI